MYEVFEHTVDLIEGAIDFEYHIAQAPQDSLFAVKPASAWSEETGWSDSIYITLPGLELNIKKEPGWKGGSSTHARSIAKLICDSLNKGHHVTHIIRDIEKYRPVG